MKNIVLLEVLVGTNELIKKLNLRERVREEEGTVERIRTGNGKPLIRDPEGQQGATDVAIGPFLFNLVLEGYKVIDAHWEDRGPKGKKVRIVFGHGGFSGFEFDLKKLSGLRAPILFGIRNEEEGTDVFVVGVLSRKDPRYGQPICPKYLEIKEGEPIVRTEQVQCFVRKAKREPTLRHSPFAVLKR